MTTKPMKLLLVIAMSLIGTIACAQQHAPLAAQCQADVRLWANERVKNEYLDAEDLKSKSGTNNRSEINSLNVHELVKREHELGQCKDVDPEHRSEYSTALKFYLSVMDDRRSYFMSRHPDIYDQFVKEDAAGER
jgi:hypothetical protein